jgi:hypothetical protein
MASQFKITTTGTLSPVAFGDLGARSFVHPTVDFNLYTEFSAAEIAASADVQAAITAGYITAEDENSTNIANVSSSVGDHASSHQSGGSDVLNVANLSGVLTNAQKQKALNYCFAAGAEVNAYTSSTSYAVLARFIFLGTTSLGTPTAIKALAFRDVETTYGIRIYDLTNSNVICELTLQTNITVAIKNMGTLSNLPTGESIFEVQMLRTGGNANNEARCSMVLIEF